MPSSIDAGGAKNSECDRVSRLQCGLDLAHVVGGRNRNAVDGNDDIALLKADIFSKRSLVYRNHRHAALVVDTHRFTLGVGERLDLDPEFVRGFRWRGFGFSGLVAQFGEAWIVLE